MGIHINRDRKFTGSQKLHEERPPPPDEDILRKLAQVLFSLFLAHKNEKSRHDVIGFLIDGDLPFPLWAEEIVPRSRYFFFRDQSSVVGGHEYQVSAGMEQAVLEQKVRGDGGFARRAVGDQLAALKHRAHVRDTRRVDIRERFARIDLRQQSFQQRTAAAFASNRTDSYIGINFIESSYERINVSLVPSGVDSQIA